MSWYALHLYYHDEQDYRMSYDWFLSHIDTQALKRDLRHFELRSIQLLRRAFKPGRSFAPARRVTRTGLVRKHTWRQHRKQTLQRKRVRACSNAPRQARQAAYRIIANAIAGKL
jgi:hypothetical protein